MATVDEPAAELVQAGEAWIWPVPHPDDPEPGDDPHVTRIGRREGARLVGLIAISTTKPKTMPFDQPFQRLTGMGPWRREKLGKLNIPYNDTGDPRGQATVTSGRVRGHWSSTGRLQVGDHKETSALATRGVRPVAPTDLRDVAGNVASTGRALLRFARGDRSALDGPSRPALGTRIEEPLVAFDGWMTATQHLVTDPGSETPVETWHVALDASRPAPPSPGVALVLAGVGLVHHSSIVRR